MDLANESWAEAAGTGAEANTGDEGTAARAVSDVDIDRAFATAFRGLPAPPPAAEEPGLAPVVFVCPEVREAAKCLGVLAAGPAAQVSDTPDRPGVAAGPEGAEGAEPRVVVSAEDAAPAEPPAEGPSVVVSAETLPEGPSVVVSAETLPEGPSVVVSAETLPEGPSVVVSAELSAEVKAPGAQAPAPPEAAQVDPGPVAAPEEVSVLDVPRRGSAAALSTLQLARVTPELLSQLRDLTSERFEARARDEGVDIEAELALLRSTRRLLVFKGTALAAGIALLVGFMAFAVAMDKKPAPSSVVAQAEPAPAPAALPPVLPIVPLLEVAQAQATLRGKPVERRQDRISRRPVMKRAHKPAARLR